MDDDADRPGPAPERVDAVPMAPGEEPDATPIRGFGTATPKRVLTVRKHAFIVGVGTVASVAAVVGIAKLIGKMRRG